MLLLGLVTHVVYFLLADIDGSTTSILSPAASQGDLIGSHDVAFLKSCGVTEVARSTHHVSRSAVRLLVIVLRDLCPAARFLIYW